MLIIREVFIAKPGQASKLAKMFKEYMPGSKIMTDMAGTFNTVVAETEVESLAAFEKRMEDYKKESKTDNKMKGYTEMYMKGKREIYQVV